MNGPGKSSDPTTPEDGAGLSEGAARSGEGSDTALEALIRKRKLQGGEATEGGFELPPATAMP